MSFTTHNSFLFLVQFCALCPKPWHLKHCWIEGVFLNSSTLKIMPVFWHISPPGQPPRTKSPGQNPPGQNPPRTKSPQTKSPCTKSPHYIPPNCSIAQYFLLYRNVIFEGQFSSTFVRCDIFHGHEVEKRS